MSTFSLSEGSNDFILINKAGKVVDVLNEEVNRMCWWVAIDRNIKALNSPFVSMPHFWQIPLSRLNTCARTLVDAYIPVDINVSI